MIVRVHVVYNLCEHNQVMQNEVIVGEEDLLKVYVLDFPMIVEYLCDVHSGKSAKVGLGFSARMGGGVSV